MCTKDCYKVFGYFLGFMWIVTAFYYTMETIELLKLMRLQCTGQAKNETLRIQFDDELVDNVCSFYGRLGKDIIDWLVHALMRTILMQIGAFLLFQMTSCRITL